MTPEQYMTLAGWVLTGSAVIGVAINQHFTNENLGQYQCKILNSLIDYIDREVNPKIKTHEAKLNILGTKDIPGLSGKIVSHEASLCEFKEEILTNIPELIRQSEAKIETLRKLHFVRDGFPLLSVTSIYNDAERRNNIISSHSQAIANLEKAIQKKHISPVKPAISAVRKPLKKANGRAHVGR